MKLCCVGRGSNQTRRDSTCLLTSAVARCEGSNPHTWLRRNAAQWRKRSIECMYISLHLGRVSACTAYPACIDHVDRDVIVVRAFREGVDASEVLARIFDGARVVRARRARALATVSSVVVALWNVVSVVAPGTEGKPDVDDRRLFARMRKSIQTVAGVCRMPVFEYSAPTQPPFYMRDVYHPTDPFHKRHPPSVAWETTARRGTGAENQRARCDEPFRKTIERRKNRVTERMRAHCTRMFVFAFATALRRGTAAVSMVWGCMCAFSSRSSEVKKCGYSTCLGAYMTAAGACAIVF